EGIDYDETYAPVARLESIRILLAYACALDFKLLQIDVKSAFLNGFINEEVCVAQPPRFIDLEKPDHVYKLKKALYSLKQAPKAWYDRLKHFLIKHEYKLGMIDNTFFTKKKSSNLIIVQIYVDDIIFGLTCQDMCDEFAKIMHDEFKMSMMGKLNFFLGLQITQMKDGIFFNQSKYIKEMLKKFRLEDYKPMKTSMSSDTKLTKGEECPISCLVSAFVPASKRLPKPLTLKRLNVSSDTLKNINEALGDKSWIVTMQEELNQFIANDVWELARLVAQGYNQQEGIDYDETYAPVARLKSIRILLAYACALDFKLLQIDVKSAFLNGFINKEVCVAQPPRFIDLEKPDHVYKLKKALYGLKQAPKACVRSGVKLLPKTKGRLSMKPDRESGLVFMGKEKRNFLTKYIMWLVDDFDAWNAFSWDEYMWEKFYNRIVNVASSSSVHFGNDEDVSHLDDNMEIDGQNAKDGYSKSQHHFHLLIKALGTKIENLSIDLVMVVPPKVDDPMLRTIKPKDDFDEADVDSYDDDYMSLLNDAKLSLNDLELQQEPDIADVKDGILENNMDWKKLDNASLPRESIRFKRSSQVVVGQQLALKSNQGDPISSFAQLPYYFYNLKLANENTVTHIDTDHEGRFKMLFLAFGVAN
nr:copia protein [Tanacetum cinerariifolium]